MTRLLPLPTTPRCLRLWARLMLSVLALALVLSQLLGQLHVIKHGRLAASPHAMVVQEAYKTPHNNGFLEQLFSSHNTSTDCRLYDQLGDGHVMAALPVAVLPVLIPSFTLAMFVRKAVRRWAALFDARGPPLTF